LRNEQIADLLLISEQLLIECVDAGELLIGQLAGRTSWESTAMKERPKP
jgi:hypothetical protein